MKTIELGPTGEQTSRLSYGCMRIAGTWNPNEITPEREKSGHQALLAAYESGYTLFDHADIYSQGGCESIHGSLLKNSPDLRKSTQIATKCGIRFPGDPNPDSPHRYDFSKEHIIWSAEQSLKRLNIEQIDIYQLHRPDVLMDPEEVAEAFTILKDAGKVRWFGVSNFSASFVDTLAKAWGDDLVVNQIEISLAYLAPFTDGTLDQCIRQNISPLAWSPIGGGWLASEENNQKDEKKITLWQTIGQLAQKYQLPRAEICLAFLLKHPSNIIPIIGTTNPERIKSAVKALEIDLDREDWYRLYTAARGKPLP